MFDFPDIRPLFYQLIWLGIVVVFGIALHYLSKAVRTRNGTWDRRGAKPETRRMPAQHDQAERSPAQKAERRPPPPPPVAPAPVVLDRHKTSELLNMRQDQVPHVGVLGGTGSRKSTFATGLLLNRTGSFVAFTFKADDWWGGLPIITIDDDGLGVTEIAAGAAALAEELGRRNRLAKANRLLSRGDQVSPGEDLTVILDDAPALFNAVPELRRIFIRVLQVGRSLGIRMVPIGYSFNVKEWGLDGMGRTLDHVLWVQMDRQHRATMVWDGKLLQIETDYFLHAGYRGNNQRFQSEAHWQPAPPAPPAPPKKDDARPVAPPAERARDEPQRTPEVAQPSAVEELAVAETPRNEERNKLKEFPGVSDPFHGIRMRDLPQDNVFRSSDFVPVARLIRAKKLTQGAFMETIARVKPGNGNRYDQARAAINLAYQIVEAHTPDELDELYGVAIQASQSIYEEDEVFA